MAASGTIIAGQGASDGPVRGAPRDLLFSDADFRALAALVHRHAGIVLGQNKQELLYGRLAKRLRQLGLSSFADYRALLEGPGGERELRHTLNAVTTNLTRFFREPHHFAHLEQEALPHLASLRAQTRRLRLWSAGCSSGEEAYTMAMVLRTAIPELDHWNARILATDIDTEMVRRGREGLYPAQQASALPDAMRQRFTQPVRAPSPSSGGLLSMTADIRQLVVFKPLNLIGAWPMRGPFDIIFCRNVVIYFDTDTQIELFRRFDAMLAEGGFLYVGHSESLHRVAPQFQPIGRTIYSKNRGRK